jgi:hypothetical protein
MKLKKHLLRFQHTQHERHARTFPKYRDSESSKIDCLFGVAFFAKVGQTPMEQQKIPNYRTTLPTYLTNLYPTVSQTTIVPCADFGLS